VWLLLYEEIFKTAPN